MRGDLPVLPFASQSAWDAWLDDNGATSTGIWLKIAKNGSGFDSVSYAEALSTALCHGWIDGQKEKFDAEHWLQRFTPRKAKSRWSKINRDSVEKLIEQGRMKPSGLREVELAKADGRWNAAYDGQRTIAVPDDFQAELDKNDRAREFFSTLRGANRYAILYRIQDAKRPETRASRIAKFVAMLSEGETIYPLLRKGQMSSGGVTYPE